MGNAPKVKNTSSPSTTDSEERSGYEENNSKPAESSYCN